MSRASQTIVAQLQRTPPPALDDLNQLAREMYPATPPERSGLFFGGRLK